MNLQELTAQVDRVRAAAPAQQQSVEDDMLAGSEISDPIKLTEALRDLDQAIADGAAAAERVIRQSEGQQLTLHVSRLQRVFITTKFLDFPLLAFIHKVNFSPDEQRRSISLQWRSCS